MSGDDVQAKVSAALRPVAGMVVPGDLAALIARWLGDYAQFRRQPGQSGVPILLLEVQHAFAEYGAAASDSRQRERDGLGASELVAFEGDAWMGTAEAAAELGISADTVRWHCRKGNLDGRRFGRQLMITLASLESLKARLSEQRGA
ncbi:helix-turn-helix domain-containing protein [Mycobacterium intracellulare]|uniref:helix-turn-helix domain-containing protein n=1 Tax=Mycobacterium intracellulare TaxID=1767 RepID=UPI00109EC7F5|nr:helix-turn-helix domain-containing protein [Mycobacterium intracellulare]